MNKDNLNKLKALRLPGMMNEYERQSKLEDIESYTFDQRITLMIDAEFDSQHNNKITRLIKNAKFSEEQADLIKEYRDNIINLNKMLIEELSSLFFGLW